MDSLSLSLPSRGAWIETLDAEASDAEFTSLPSRGAWIETLMGKQLRLTCVVAPLAGSVD